MWILEDLVGICLIAVNVDPNRFPHTPCSTEPVDDPGAICEYYPQALQERGDEDELVQCDM